MTRSQKAYTINQYNKARIRQGLRPIRNPFSTLKNSPDNNIHTNPDGTETITPKSTNVKIGPINKFTSNDPTLTDPQLQQVIDMIDNLNPNELSNLLYPSAAPHQGTTEPTPGTSGVSEGGSKKQKTDHRPQTKRPAEEGPQQQPPPKKLLDFFDQGNTDEVDEFIANQPTPEPVSNMPGGTDGAPMASAQKAATGMTGLGGSGASSGGFDSMQGPDHYIPLTKYSYEHGSMHFTKVHQFKTYACPYTLASINSAPNSREEIVTPLMEINWDKPFFYMSSEEFNLIPPGSYFKDCEIEIQIIGASVSYPIGSTTATDSVTGHPKIGIIGFDLFNKIRGGTSRKVTFASNTVVPVSIESDNQYDEFIRTQYGDLQNDNVSIQEKVLPGVALSIPFWNTNYLTIPWNLPLNQTNSKMLEIMSINDFSRHIVQFNINDSSWSRVIKRKYSFSSAPVGARFRSYDMMAGYKSGTFPGSVDSGTGIRQAIGIADNHNLVRDTTNLTVNQTQVVSLNTTDENNVNLVTYKNLIEKGAYNQIGSIACKPARQPSIHIGMKAIGKPFGASNRADSFVNAYLQFNVIAKCNVVTGGYPNSFVRPSRFQVDFENAEMGIVNKTPPDNRADISYGLYSEDLTSNVPASLDIDTVTSRHMPSPVINKRQKVG